MVFAMADTLGLLRWCPDIIGFLRYGPRYWRVMRAMGRRVYERSKK